MVQVKVKGVTDRKEEGHRWEGKVGCLSSHNKKHDQPEFVIFLFYCWSKAECCEFSNFMYMNTTLVFLALHILTNVTTIQNSYVGWPRVILYSFPFY